MRTVQNATIFSCIGRASDLAVVQVTDRAMEQFANLVAKNAPSFDVQSDAGIEGAFKKMLRNAQLTRSQTGFGEWVHLYDAEFDTFVSFKLGVGVIEGVRRIEFPRDVRVHHGKPAIGWVGVTPEAWQAFNEIADRRFREKGVVRTVTMLHERAIELEDSVRRHKSRIAGGAAFVHDSSLRIRYMIDIAQKMLVQAEDTLPAST